MVGVVGAEEALMLARHEPEEIAVVSRRADGRVVAGGELHQLVLLDGVGLVDGAVAGVHPLNGEALLGLEEEVVYLLKYALLRHVVRVVLVRREARPVAGAGRTGVDRGGDLGLGRHITSTARNKNDFSWSFQQISPWLLSNDFNLATYGVSRILQCAKAL